jgi:hypothetical protein
MYTAMAEKPSQNQYILFLEKWAGMLYTDCVVAAGFPVCVGGRKAVPYTSREAVPTPRGRCGPFSF